MESEIERETLTVEEAGRILGIGRNKAYEAVQSGDIPSLRFGKRIVVPRKAFDRLLGMSEGKLSQALGRARAAETAA